jgi:hypothetical protein
VSEVSNGKTSLVGYVRAFERVNGRTPTEAENREALALVEVVRESNLDPFLVYYLANKRAQDALERVPVETRKVMDDAAARIVAGTMGPKEREELFAALSRLEQRADNAAKQPAAVPAIPADLSSSIARLAEQLRATSPADPFAGIMPYVFAFVAGALVCELVFGAISYRVFPPVFAEVGFFTLGLSASAAALLWLWLAPIIRAARRGR